MILIKDGHIWAVLDKQGRDIGYVYENLEGLVAFCPQNHSNNLSLNNLQDLVALMKLLVEQEEPCW